MEMQWFEKVVVNTFSRPYLRWFLLPRVCALMDAPLGGRGLALGPGVGWETLAIAERFPRAAIVGVEYDGGQVARARRNLNARAGLATRVSFEQGDATRLRFGEGAFDFAYELNVLHHIHDYPAAIREVHRVLKPGAAFYVQDLSRRFFPPGVRRLFPPESLFTRAELVAELWRAGFAVEAARGNAVVFVRARRH